MKFMEPNKPTEIVAEYNPEVAEGIKRARAAFIRDFPKLIADRKTLGKYVCYHNDTCVAVTKSYRSMIDEVIKKDIPEDAYLIFQVLPDEQRIQKCYELEIDPDEGICPP
jgi:hypothetical protein